MAWTVNVSPRAQRQLDELDKSVARRISRFLHERIAKLNDVRQIGERLQGCLLKKPRVSD